MENSDGFRVTGTIPAPSLPYGKPGTTYTVVQLPDDPTQGANLNTLFVFIVTTLYNFLICFVFKGAWYLNFYSYE